MGQNEAPQDHGVSQLDLNISSRAALDVGILVARQRAVACRITPMSCSSGLEKRSPTL